MSKETTRNTFKFHHGEGEELNGLGNNTWSPSNRRNTGVRRRRLLRGVISVIQISQQTEPRGHTPHPLLDTRRDTEPVNSTSPGDSPWRKKRPRMSVLSDCICSH
ncbi:hypothetical protein ARMGADRAFT_1012238 [Armillaria gallica]|uniref:Uncharacterized protein n=1 Tax=Armillaria gallica TaxID=47427 RepID=A0A2H3DTI6_ARMGA|nr:hypothetical protein ARMGADRAFT_1012238 [Armillaria gallica]